MVCMRTCQAATTGASATWGYEAGTDSGECTSVHAYDVGQVVGGLPHCTALTKLSRPTLQMWICVTSAVGARTTLATAAPAPRVSASGWAQRL